MVSIALALGRNGIEGKEFLVGDKFTMADIVVHYALFLGRSLGLDERYKLNCQCYLASMMERDGFKRAKKSSSDKSKPLENGQ